MRTYRTQITARSPLVQPSAYRARVQKARAKSVSLPAPVGGWNARDSIADMPKDDAVELINYFPDTTTVKLRFGYTAHSLSVSGQVETLMPWNAGAVERLFAATSNGFIYNTTSADDILTDETGAYILTEGGDTLILENVNSVLQVSGLSNGRWQHVNFTTSGGNYICAVNGADAYRVYNGTAWAKDGDGAPYNITGVTSSTLIGINVFKNRLWFIEIGSLKAWYLPVNSIGGATASLDMSSLCSEGGYLMAMGTWTIDAGYGVDDYAVWITSKGQVLVWRMTDPTDPNAIFLIGVWQIGAPIGRRCFQKWKGDLLLITQEGLVPLSKALQSSRLDPRVSLTDKIQQAISASITSYKSNFGWQIQSFPEQNMLLLNVPVQQGNDQEQYVMNTITGAWGRFQGWEANCWALYQDELYFGGNNMIGHAWDTNADIQMAISGSILQAFNYFGSPAQLKRFTMMRPTFYANGAPSIQANINVNFDQSAPSSNLNTVPIQGALWDSGVWDVGQWGASLSLITAWQGANGVGYCGAPRLASMTNGFEVQLVSTDIVLETGEIL